MLRLVQELVRIPSVNGQHTEQEVVGYLLKEGAALGLRGEIFALDETRPNIVFSIGSGPPRFLFVAHLDTVAVGDPSFWTHPPFAGEVEGGRLYARGACDNKGGMVCGLFTLLRLLEKAGGKELPCIQLAGVVDEESGACSSLGVKYLLERNIIGGEGAIYTYPGRKVTIGHRGSLRVRMVIIGQAVHSGVEEWCNKKKGANAVTALAEMLYFIDKYDWPKDYHDSFPGLSFTITPTIVTGGNFESIDTDAKKVLEVLDGIMQSVLSSRNEQLKGSNTDAPDRLTGSISIKNELPAAFIATDHPLAHACSWAVEQVTGKLPEVGGCGPANEGYMLIKAGIPTICGFGPEGGGPHAANEWLGVDSLAETVDIYTRVVCRFLGLDL